MIEPAVTEWGQSKVQSTNDPFWLESENEDSCLLWD